MQSKIREKNHAIRLRKQGRSYSEILEKVKVSQASLSLWLSEIKLSKKHRIRLADKQKAQAYLGSQMRSSMRIEKERRLITKGTNKIKALSNYEKLLIGVALYWAEGAKQKIHNVSARVSFSNSDPEMIQIFIDWLVIICNINRSRLSFELYIHQNSQSIKSAIEYWTKTLALSNGSIKIRLKRHKVSIHRKNIGSDYRGLVKVSISRSTDLNRLIKGMQDGIVEKWGVV